MTVYVFVGPTLAVEDAQSELDAVYLPPVSQGDVYRVGLLRPNAIGIIDGYFDRVPAVWHKEILWAMTRGIHVFGSASIGALRAAELDAFGMEGVGAVYEMYRKGVIEDDDEVAVIHGPAETGYLSLSVAIVNIRATLARAEADGIVPAATARALIAIAKNLFYRERSYPTILARAAADGLPSAELQALTSWLPAGELNQKRNDALAMLRRIRECARTGWKRKHVAFKLEHTIFWDALTRLGGGIEEQLETETAFLTTDDVLDELRLRGFAYLDARQQALVRDLALREAQHQGYRIDEAAVHRQEVEFRDAYGLTNDDAFARWQRENHVSASGLENLMEEEAIMASVLGDRTVEIGPLLDHLRVTQQYGQLRARALDKQRRLKENGLQYPTFDQVGITRQELLDWYFRHLGPLFKRDEARHARSFGLANVEELLRVLLKEYCYVSCSTSSVDAAARSEVEPIT